MFYAHFFKYPALLPPKVHVIPICKRIHIDFRWKQNWVCEQRLVPRNLGTLWAPNGYECLQSDLGISKMKKWYSTFPIAIFEAYVDKQRFG